MATERWLAARRREVLPIPYFHVVFTLPHALNPLAQSHPRLIYRLLFQAAASTLLRFGRDPRQLGGDLGGTAVLHTWGQTLTQHVHLYCVVTGGALARDGARWHPARPAFLFPVRALAKVFRGRYLAGLRRAFDRGELHPTGGVAALAEPPAFAAWLEALRTQAWVVYCKPPFAGPEHVLAYLGRYTHRVALSNHRLVAFADGRVRFSWRDYTDDDRLKVMDLAVDEFLRRFLLHVVPDGFVRIRHFGLLANRRCAAALARCRLLLTHPAPPVEPPPSVRPRAAPHWPRHRALSGLSAGRPAVDRGPAPPCLPGTPREPPLQVDPAPAAADPRRLRRHSSVPSSLSLPQTRALGCRAPRPQVAVLAAPGGRATRRLSAPPLGPAPRPTVSTIESPYLMQTPGLVQLVLSAMLGARRIKA